MEIYYLKKKEFLTSIDTASLETFSDGRQYLSQDKYVEHLCGLFLTKFIAKHIYDINNPQIELCGGKPFFKNEKIFFSISHSNDVVLVAFNNRNIGVDVEYMCERNYKGIMKRYGKVSDNPARTEFYKFWTVHEAEIKLNSEIKSLFSALLEKDYLFSCVSDDILVTDFCIKKLFSNGKNIDLVKEFGYPKYLYLKK